jgi:hypothetical protein
LNNKQDQEFKLALEKLIKNAASENYLEDDLAFLITKINR